MYVCFPLRYGCTSAAHHDQRLSIRCARTKAAVRHDSCRFCEEHEAHAAVPGCASAGALSPSEALLALSGRPSSETRKTSRKVPREPTQKFPRRVRRHCQQKEGVRGRRSNRIQAAQHEIRAPVAALKTMDAARRQYDRRGIHHARLHTVHARKVLSGQRPTTPCMRLRSWRLMRVEHRRTSNDGSESIVARANTAAGWQRTHILHKCLRMLLSATLTTRYAAQQRTPRTAYNYNIPPPPVSPPHVSLKNACYGSLHKQAMRAEKAA